MQAKLIQIGNSKGLRIPKSYIEQFDLDKGKIEIVIETDGIKIKRLSSIPPIETWELLFQQAEKNNEKPENDFFEGIANSIDDSDWTW